MMDVGSEKEMREEINGTGRERRLSASLRTGISRLQALEIAASSRHAIRGRALLCPIATLARRILPAQALGNRGAAMVEFCIAALPFMTMLFGTVELGLMYVTNACLTNATATIARQVRVGTVTLPGNGVATGTGKQMTLSAFKTAICRGVAIMDTASCVAQLQVDVRVQSSFGGSTSRAAVTNGSFSGAGFCFYSGSPGNVVTMRTYLPWGIATPLLLNMISNVSSVTASDGSTSTGTFVLLSSSESFKNEPNPNTINTGNGC